jgi:glutamate-1-semialdehyde 2,1-aminomutase
MFPAPGSPSERAYARACDVMPGGSSRLALYDMRSYAQAGDGCRLRDIDGKVWLDALNNFMVLIHGHRHAPTIAALRDQLDRGTSFGLPDTSEVALAAELCGRVASVERVVFCNSGSEAVMHAIKAARIATGRPCLAKCEGLYHGAYDYAEVSNGAPVVPGFQGFPQPQPYGPYMAPHVLEDVIVIPFNDPVITERVLRDRAAEIAAILIDPVPSRIGYALAEPAYLQLLRRLADELGILLIFDEVASFRAAHGGAQSLSGVRPDLTTFGKIIGGGMPAGAIGGSEAVMRVFDPAGGKKSLAFTGTFNANPMTMAAGLATLRDYPPEAVARLNALGAQLRGLVAAGIARLSLPAQVHGCASFVALFFEPRMGNGYHAVAHRPAELPLVRRFWAAAMDRGLLLDVTARLNLSTAFGPAEVEEAAAIILAALEQAYDGAAPEVAACA